MRTALTRALRVLADCLGVSTPNRNAAAAIKAVPPSARRTSSLRRAVNSIFEPLEQRAMFSTYFISPGGSDGNSGTSTSSAWKSIGKVDSYHFGPGDQVLFQGGQTFSGELKFNNDGGSAGNPVTIGSYGGRATIYSGSNTGAWVLNSTGIRFDNLKFVGSIGDKNGQDGIRIENFGANTVRSGISVNNCDISGYAQAGIVFGSDAANEGLNNISITNNDIYNNMMAGIQSYAVTTESNTNIYIGSNLVHDNYGDNVSTVTGSGIMLQGLNGATIEHNSAYNNGARGGNGCVGIWTYSSNDVLVQYNASYNNHGLHGDDGDGFDFDADTSNSIMQYNYSANNDGGGLQLNQWWNTNNETGDIIRYNISQNNGRRNNYSGIDVWGKVINAQIYNNTVYNSPAVTGMTSAIRISNNRITFLHPDNIRIANNIFVTTGGTPLIDFYSAALSGSSNISFTGNVYYSYSGAARFVWGPSTYSTLSGFQSGTGQEKLYGSPVGAYADPKLAAPGAAGAPSGVFSLSQITEYNLLSSTPIVNAGVSLASVLGVNIGKTVPGLDQSLTGAIPTSTTGNPPPVTNPSVKPGKIGQGSLSGFDIGGPKKGTNSISGSTYSVTGGGASLSTNSDSFRYVFTTLTGNGQIVAQLTSLSNPSGSAVAGLMIRNTTAANSSAVSLLLNNVQRAYFLSRSTAGAAPAIHGTSDGGAQWVKLVRKGNVFSAYISANGSSWSLVGSSTVAMNSTVLIGLAASSQSTGSTETGVFKNVSFSGTVTA